MGILLWCVFALLWLRSPVDWAANNGASLSGWADSSENMLCPEALFKGIPGNAVREASPHRQVLEIEMPVHL